MCSSQIENDHKLRNVLDECVGRIDLRNEQESEHPGLYWSMPGTIARYSFTQRKKNAPRKGFPNLLRYPGDVAQQGPHASVCIQKPGINQRELEAESPW